MKLPAAVWRLAGLMGLAIAGFVLPGPLGQACAYAWLGVFPGVAIARLLVPRASDGTRWTLGLLLSPLVTMLAGWALVTAGQPLQTAARLVAVAGWVLFALGERQALGHACEDTDTPTPSRFATAWIVGALLFALLPLANPWTLVRSDAWFHAAVVREMQHHGLALQDPRYAGMPLNYMWMYHLFLTLALAVKPGDPFVTMAIFNLVTLFATLALARHLAWMAWRDERAVRGALVMLTIGMNAGTWVLWPLRLVKALRGEVTGWAEVQRQLQTTRLLSTDVLYFLQAPFAWMVNFWDKYTVATALGYGYALWMLHAWAFARWLSSGSPRWVIVGGVAAAGVMLVHGVVGLSVIPVSLGAFALAAVLRPRAPWLPGPRPLAAFAGATLLGAALAGPYMVAISSGWGAEKSGLQHRYLHFDLLMPWTIATALAIPLALALPAVRRVIAERREFAAWLAMWVLGMLAFSFVVHLPEGNEHKFVFQLLVPLSLLAGPFVTPAFGRWRERLGPVAFALAVAVLFAVPAVLFQVGYLADPGRHREPALNPRPGEGRLYDWIRTATPANAVFTDHRSRDLIMVYGERRLLAGTTFGPEKAGFPLDGLLERRRRMAELYDSTATAVVRADSLTAIARALNAPIYVVYRPTDWAEGVTPWTRLDAESTVFRRVFDERDYRVYTVEP